MQDYRRPSLHLSGCRFAYSGVILSYVDSVNCSWNVIDLCESGRAGIRRRQGFGRQEGWEEVRMGLEDEASGVNRIQMWFAVDAIQR
jgi:hypothetical protein